jgi:hypothetical protein
MLRSYENSVFYIRKNKINKKLRGINIYVILTLSPSPVQNKIFFSNIKYCYVKFRKLADFLSPSGDSVAEFLVPDWGI